MRLTIAAIRTLALPRGINDKVFFDDDLPGFGLRVRRSGARSWLVQYTNKAGRDRRVTLGNPATLELAAARNAARQLLAKVHLGGDPVAEQATARLRSAETLGALLPQFLERYRATRKPRSCQEADRHLSVHAKPLHGEPITIIDRRMVATRLGEIARASGPAAANRVRASLSAFFTWAAREGFVESNPVAYTNKAVENDPRERVLSDAEVATIGRVLGEGQGQYDTILTLLLLLGLRRDAIGGLRWSELDLDAATITLPPARTKNRREFVVPVPPMALSIIKAQPRRDGRDHVFGQGIGRGFQDWSGSKQDLDARIEAANGQPLEHWTLHDFRRTLSTTMNERLGVLAHIVEAVLEHARGGHQAGTAGTYNKAIYIDERRRALTRWADHVTGLITGKRTTAEVVPLHA